MATSGPDLLVAAFLALNEDERQEAHERIHVVQLDTLAGDRSEAGRYIDSMRRVAVEVGHVPSTDDYKRVQAALAGTTEPIETFSRLYRHFGSWPRATEALELSKVTTAQAIEARFRDRRVGKVWRYTEDLMRDTLLRCSEHWGRPPSTQEFAWWRQRELELAAAAGKDIFLPSDNPYRKRFGTWEATLLHFGFTPEQVALRLEGKQQPPRPKARLSVPDDLPVAVLRSVADEVLPLTDEQLGRMVAEWESLPRRSHYVLTVRLGLADVEVLTLREAAEPLGLHLDRIRQLQVAALGALSRAAAGGRRNEPTPEDLLRPVQETLKLLAFLPN